MKMMRWEEPLAQQIRALRRMEAANVRSMSRIRATIMAIQFSIVAVVAFITFTVYRWQRVAKL